ncbi:MAG: hypothetical protein QXJ51_04075 [Sulfolobales archaeon]
MKSSESISFRRLAGFLEFILEYLFYSVFVGDDNKCRHSPLVLNIGFIVVVIFIISRGGFLNIITGVSAVALQIVLKRKCIVLRPVIILSLIPSAFYGVISIILRPDIILALEAVARVFTISLSTLLVLQQINPVEISWLLSRLGVNSRSVLYPSLVWRVSPHLLKDMRLALLVNRLKESDLWKSIAVSIIVFDEYADLYEEGLLSREKISISYWYDPRESIKSVILLITPLIMYMLQCMYSYSFLLYLGIL